MKTISKYQEVKTMLRANAEFAKVQFRGDKPAIRQSINDYTDAISKDYNLSEYQRNLLSNYACTLHPKN
jgi:hypothetical protein